MRNFFQLSEPQNPLKTQYYIMTKKLFLILFVACAYSASGQNLVWQTNPTTLWTPGKVGIGENNTTNSQLLISPIYNWGNMSPVVAQYPCPTYDPYFWVRKKDIINNITYSTDLFSVNDVGAAIGLKNALYPLHIQTGYTPTDFITAYMGTNPLNTTSGPRNMFFVNNLSNNGAFNAIQKSGDQGIFWNDGKNSTIGTDYCNAALYTNSTAGFIIAPYQDANAANPATGFRIDASGKVGIGIKSPVEMLEVAGNIKCTKLIVTTQWWDKVFEKDYKLLTLPELEKYILANKHLPDLPTEQDIAKNGCDVGETAALLLKKVEELTLYTIELQKQVDELKKLLLDKK